ncbi:MAG: DUF4397 domain-containing protein [Flavobacteriales bacterium]|nr:DUF4397 domain-containing protein [Flavobacteriales bacterium]
MNSSGPAFGLWAALASGGPLVELPAASIPMARVQVMHNSADAAASSVDVWLNDGLLLDDFAFRTASPFVDAQAGVPFDVTIAGPGSTDTTSAVARYTYELDADETYILVANGIVSGSGYMPVQPFDIYVFGGARETATSGAGNTDILVFHGSTDAPTVSVVETAVLGGATLVSNMSYGEFGNNAYLEPPTNDYTLEIQAGGTPVVAYDAPLATLGLQGEAITVLASGFLDPTMNSNGPAFGLWVALAGGGPLVELPISTSVNELDRLTGFTAWPNPANDILYVDLNTVEGLQASMVLTDMTGRTVRRTDGLNLAAGESRLVMDMQGLSEGLYQLSIVGNDVIRTAQVQVMR